MDEQTNGHTDERAISRLDIIYIFQAYNRGEFGYDELIEKTRVWSAAMRRQYSQPIRQPQTEAALD